MDIRSYFFYIIAGGDKRWRASFLRAFLRMLSWFYALGVAVIRYLYQKNVLKRYTIARPVICIGNITCGGCGKTPLVAYCAKALEEKGCRPAVLMRGYMRKKWGVSPATSDEAELLRKALPSVSVTVNPDRVQGAMDALAGGTVDVFLMDDGFQHWRVKRDLDIVVVDATNPFGCGAVLPRGLLREPLSGLKRAQSIVITRSDLVSERDLETICATVKRYNADAPIVKAVHQPLDYICLRTGERKPLTMFNNSRVGLVSAIGNPCAFTKTMERLGAHCVFHHSLPDHHVYGRQDVRDVLDQLKTHDIKTLVMTEKDSEKFKEFLADSDSDIDVVALRIGMVIQEGEYEFLERLQRFLRT